jgi:alkaline phosphatase
MSDTTITLGRRAFLQGGTLTLLAAGLDLVPASLPAGDTATPKLRIGLLTDLHYADKPLKGTRFYRETPAKLDEAVRLFSNDKPDFTVELGDLIDAADDVEVEKRWLRTIHEQFSQIPGPKHFVLGNHCVDTLTKEEFLGGVGQKESYYSFDSGGFHFVVLDGCFRSDGVPYGRKNSMWDDANVPAAELDWLRSDLGGTTHPTIVFAHQRLDGTGPHHVRNAADVRKALEDSGRVLAVFQGHSHQNDYKLVGGIHYATLVAMIEGSGEPNNGYAVAEVAEGGTIHVRGYRKQVGYDWKRG